MSLDSNDPYLMLVRNQIRQKWAFPCEPANGNGGTTVMTPITLAPHQSVTLPSTGCEFRSARVEVEFGVATGGVVTYVIVRKPSGHDIYDEYAVKAVRLASPFPPVPDSLMSSGKGIVVTGTFNYVVEHKGPVPER
jgi:TonB family protein